jgi:hypothetical protein
VTPRDDLERNYRTAFLRYLPRREEVALTRGYEVGRATVVDGTSLLDLVQVHHEILLEVLQDTSADELSSVTAAAAEFLVEVLATYDMTQRGLLEQA